MSTTLMGYSLGSQCADTPSKKPGKAFLIGVCVWGALMFAGFAAIAIYSLTPGDVSTPSDWHDLGSSFQSPKDGHLLVMAVHPKCPCTRASVGELARIMRYAHENLSCLVLVYEPDQAPKAWRQTDIVRSLRSIANTELRYDAEGQLAKQLGMVTSGSTVLYAPDGSPVFFGGITAARSHHGDNLGSDAILAVLAGDRPLNDQTPVYGCPLLAKTSACSEMNTTCQEVERP